MTQRDRVPSPWRDRALRFARTIVFVIGTILLGVLLIEFRSAFLSPIAGPIPMSASGRALIEGIWLLGTLSCLIPRAKFVPFWIVNAPLLGNAWFALHLRAIFWSADGVSIHALPVAAIVALALVGGVPYRQVLAVNVVIIAATVLLAVQHSLVAVN